jgi:predicted transposase YbfD/YdcC
LKTVIETGNDYVVKVKGNQPKLLKAVKQTVETSEPVDFHKTAEKSRGRFEEREVSVFNLSPDIPVPEDWCGINRIIYVHRQFQTEKGLHQSNSWYISSVKSDKADYFADGIRRHWHIENRLHYVKDVIMNEDTSGIKDMTAAGNISIFRSIAINIARKEYSDSVKYSSIFFAGNVKELLKIMRT